MYTYCTWYQLSIVYEYVVSQIIDVITPSTKHKLKEYTPVTKNSHFSKKKMVLYLLCFKAELENVGEVRLRTHGIHLRISVRNPQDGDEVRKNVIVDPGEPLEPEDGSSKEGPHHFRIRWEGSKKAGILQVLTEAETATAMKKLKKKKRGGKSDCRPRGYTADDSGDWVPMLAVECRGLEPFEFNPMKDEFVITSEGGAVFDEGIELDDGEWCDYDAESDAPVSMEDVAFKFEAL